MKKLIGLTCAVVLIAACGGGSGGSSAAEQAAENSIQGLASAIFTDDCLALLNTGTPGTCNCSGSGTLTVTVTPAASLTAKDTITATAADCIDAESGLDFNGSVAIDDETGDATMNFPEFGQCTNVTGALQDVGEICSGRVTGTCADSSYTCNLEDGPDDECECS